MKNKKFSLVLAMLILVSFSFNSFAGSNATRVNNSTTQKTTNTANATKTTTKQGEVSTEADIDLVALNQTMLYSQLTNINNEYEKYLGKRIRMVGTMNVYQGDIANYFLVECSDVTACCNTGLEFILKGGSTKIEDYPKSGDRVLVNGVLEKYYEGTNPYIHLVNTECKVLNAAKKS